jgi:hypothetical protein
MDVRSVENGGAHGGGRREALWIKYLALTLRALCALARRNGALALRVVADRLEHGEEDPNHLASISFAAA